MLSRPLIVSWGLPIAFLFGTTGCQEKSGTESKSPTVSSISIAFPSKSGFAESWQAALGEWTARTHVQHTLVESDVTNLTTGPLPGDLNLIPFTAAAGMAFRKEIGSIPVTVREESQLDWNGLFQGLREKAGSPNGSPGVIPVSSPVLVLYYRADLLSKSGKRPPETWEEYLKLLEELPEWGAGLQGIEPWEENWGATLYLARAASYAKHPEHTTFLFDFESGDSLIELGGFQKAWDVSQQVLKHLSPKVREMSPAECRREILEGRAALAITTEAYCLNRSTADDLSTMKEVRRAEGIEIGFVQLPGTREVFNPTLKSWEPVRENGVYHVALTGFDGLCAVISSKTSEQGALLAWNMLQALSIDEEGLFPRETVSPTRETDLTRPDAFTGNALLPNEKGEYLSIVGRSLRSRHLVLEMPLIGREKFLSALTECIRPSLEGQAQPAAEFTHKVAEKWSGIQGELGKTLVRDSYRCGSGARPMPKSDLPPLTPNEKVPSR